MNTHPQIAKRAYEIWEQAGRPHGKELQHWLQAEAESHTATAVHTKAAPTPAPPALKPAKNRRATGAVSAASPA